MRAALIVFLPGAMVCAVQEDVMKTSRMVAIILLLAGCTSVAAAQNRVVARFSIPFGFTAHGQEFDSGEYVLRQIGAQTVRCERTDSAVGITLISPQSVSDRDPVTLTFRVVGDRYFLSAVKAPSFQIALPLSRIEVDLARSHKVRKVDIAERR